MALELDWKAKFNYRGELSRVRVNTREISLARKKHFATEKVRDWTATCLPETRWNTSPRKINRKQKRSASQVKTKLDSQVAVEMDKYL